MRLAFISLLLWTLGGTSLHAAPVRYDSLATWSAAAGGAGQLQDFSGYAIGTPMSGTEFLPGVKATTSMDELEIFGGSSGNHRLFGTGGRQGPAATYYDLQLALPYSAVALAIVGFETGTNSGASGPGTLRVSLADSTEFDFSVFALSDGSEIFIGFVSDIAITNIRWTEVLESNGLGFEETSLDNIRVVANAVPEPGTALLAALALLAVGFSGRQGLKHRA